MINPYVLQLLAMRQRGMNPYGSTAMDYPEPPDIYGVRPWTTPWTPPSPAPVPGADAPLPDEPIPEFDAAGAEQRARRAGLGALGIALLAGAGKGDYAGSLAEGLAAMAATRQQRFEGERNQFRQDAQERLARETYDRQNRLTQAQIRNYNADNERAQRAAEAQVEARRQDAIRQQEIVDALPAGERRDRLSRLVGASPEEFRKYYWEATEPPEPAKPNFFELSPGQTRYRYEEGKDPEVIASRPPSPSSGGGRMSTEEAAARAAAIADAVETVRERHGKGTPTQEQLHDDVQTVFDRKYNAWLKQRMEGVGDPVSTEKQLELQKKGHKGIAIKRGPGEMKLKTPSGRVLTEDQFMRERLWQEATEEVRRSQAQARSQREDMVYHFDEYGNPVP